MVKRERSKRRARAGDPTIAVAYSRVSTDEQQLGPEAQRAAIEAWAEREHVRIVAWHGDHGVSGAAEIDKRPGLLAALHSLSEHRAGVLVTAKRDRLARDVVKAATIERLTERAGARVVSADGVGLGDGPEAALLRVMVDGFAAYERDLIRARTRAALAAKRARGELTGSAPLGKRVADDGLHLVDDPAESAAVERVLAMRSQGLSVRAIAKRLTEEGTPSRGRRGWHRQSVWRVIARHTVTKTPGT